MNKLPKFRQISMDPCDPMKFCLNLDYIQKKVRHGSLTPNKINNLISVSGLCAADQALLYERVLDLFDSRG